MGVHYFLAKVGRFSLSHGGLFDFDWSGAVVAGIASGLVCSISIGGTVRFQHHHTKTVVDRPSKGFAAGHHHWLSAVGLDLETGGVDGFVVVVLGLGCSNGIPISNRSAGTGVDLTVV